MQARTDGWRSVSSGIRSMRRPAIHSDDDDDDDDDGDLLRTCFLILAFTSVIFLVCAQRWREKRTTFFIRWFP